MMANPEWTDPSDWNDRAYEVVPVKAPADGPCVECAESVAEWFAVYEREEGAATGSLVDLFASRADADEFVAEQVSA